MVKGKWKTCGHCDGSGVCKNNLKGFQTIIWFIPFPVKFSCASCLMSQGIDPLRNDARVICSTCEGTGYVWCGSNGERNAKTPK